MAAEKPKPKKAAKKTRGRRGQRRATAELLIEQRREKVCKLRLAGWNLQDIAGHLKCSVGTVHSDLEAVLQRTQEAANVSVDLHRQISLARLDVANKAIWPSVENGDHDAIDRLIKLEARRAKLLGTDMPAKREISGPDGGPLEFAASTLKSKLEDLGKRLAESGSEPGGTPGAGSEGSG